MPLLLTHRLTKGKFDSILLHFVEVLLHISGRHFYKCGSKDTIWSKVQCRSVMKLHKKSMNFTLNGQFAVIDDLVLSRPIENLSDIVKGIDDDHLRMSLCIVL